MRQNLNPNIWGPHAWFFLESIAIGYPDNPTKEEKIKAKNFFLLLESLLSFFLPTSSRLADGLPTLP